MAWLLAQGDDIIPIPGSKQIPYIEENLGALNVKLTDGELKKVREAIVESEKHLGDGARAPEFLLNMSWIETPLPGAKKA